MEALCIMFRSPAKISLRYPKVPRKARDLDREASRLVQPRRIFNSAVPPTGSPNCSLIIDLSVLLGNCYTALVATRGNERDYSFQPG